MSDPTKLNFTALSDEPVKQRDSRAKSSGVYGGRRRRKKDDHLNMVQMSIRMEEGVYDVFKSICEEERYTNGEMLEIMMNCFLRDRQKKL